MIRTEIEDTGRFKDKLKEFREQTMNAAQRAVKETTDIFFGQVRRNISLSPHGATPAQHYYRLGADYDHPFAARHFFIMPHDHDPVWGVHTVTGKMLRTFSKWYHLEDKNNPYGLVGWDLSTIPVEVLYVIRAREKMLPRPILQLTWQQIDVDKILIDKFKEYSGIK